VGINFHYLIIMLFSFSAHPFYLWLAMIMWLVTQEQMWIQVKTLMR